MKSQRANLSPADESEIEEGLRAAEEAIAELAQSFAGSASDELARARGLLKEVEPDPADGKAQLGEIFVICHNLKGQAGSFGYGLMTKIAGNLCDYFRTVGLEGPVQPAVIEGHLMALEFIAHRGVKGDGGEVGKALLEKLAKLIPPRG